MSAKESFKNRTNELVGESEGKQANGRASLFHVLLSELPTNGMPTFGVGFPASHNLTKRVLHRSAQWLAVLGDSRSSEVDNQISHHTQKAPCFHASQGPCFSFMSSNTLHTVICFLLHCNSIRQWAC